MYIGIKKKMVPEYWIVYIKELKSNGMLMTKVVTYAYFLFEWVNFC